MDFLIDRGSSIGITYEGMLAKFDKVDLLRIKFFSQATLFGLLLKI
jgi:hypothetical protein